MSSSPPDASSSMRSGRSVIDRPPIAYCSAPRRDVPRTAAATSPARAAALPAARRSRFRARRAGCDSGRRAGNACAACRWAHVAHLAFERAVVDREQLFLRPQRCPTARRALDAAARRGRRGSTPRLTRGSGVASQAQFRLRAKCTARLQLHRAAPPRACSAGSGGARSSGSCSRSVAARRRPAQRRRAPCAVRPGALRCTIAPAADCVRARVAVALRPAEHDRRALLIHRCSCSSRVPQHAAAVASGIPRLAAARAESAHRD